MGEAHGRSGFALGFGCRAHRAEAAKGKHELLPAFADGHGAPLGVEAGTLGRGGLAAIVVFGIAFHFNSFILFPNACAEGRSHQFRFEIQSI
jgi:hypothetical protein